jgi:acetyl/propionyl-CoA carboxylase alpha subunit
VANRGEVAVRILRTCRDLGLSSVAVYEPLEREALTVRLADWCVELTGTLGYRDAEQLVAIAKERGCDALHPGYGYFAENSRFVRRCEDAGIRFVGPDAATLATVSDKVGAMRAAAAAGFETPEHSARSYEEGQQEEAAVDAACLGYPLLVKSTRGGRGRGMRLVRKPEQFAEAFRAAQEQTELNYGNRRVFLERYFRRVHVLGVQVLADDAGEIAVLGEREGSVQRGNQKLVDETPSPWLGPERRRDLQEKAVRLTRLFGCCGASTVEFLGMPDGRFLFTEIKPRLQREHLVTEMVTGIDLVSWQLRLAAGERLDATLPEAAARRGHAIQCRINAQDPWHDFLPSPGRVQWMRLPGGPHVRTDTHLVPGAEVPAAYDPGLATVAVRGETREIAVRRLTRALVEMTFVGVPNDVPLHVRFVRDPRFLAGDYDASFFSPELLKGNGDQGHRRDLAVLAALAYVRHHLDFKPELPEEALTGWFRESRRVP